MPYKINENTKTFSKQSVPEDGLNTRNRAGNDSKQQAYIHATVFNRNNLYSINHLDLFRPLYLERLQKQLKWTFTTS